MHAVRYRPEARTDAWRAAVTPSALAVLAPDVTPRAAETVWRRLDDGGIAAVLDALTSAFGTSLTAIPPFALVVREPGGIRVAVRGTIELVVESAGGTDAVSGHGVATWVEQFFADVHRVTASVGSDSDLTDALPISSGVVPVAAVEFTLDADRPSGAAAARAAAAGSAPAATAPEPVAEPAPEPIAPPEPAVEQPAPMETVAPPEATAVAPGEDEELWGETVAVPRPNRPAAEAAASAPAPAVPPTPPAPPTEQLGDHDGATISVAEFRALRDGILDAEPTEIVPPRTPTRGRVRISDGRVVELERTVVIGRRPRSTRPAESELPTLVAVDGPQHDISRNHVELRAEGETILAVDLDSTNGTLLRRGTQDPVRLHPNEPTIVVDGDVLDLGDGVTLAFEGIR